MGPISSSSSHEGSVSNMMQSAADLGKQALDATGISDTVGKVQDTFMCLKNPVDCMISSVISWITNLTAQKLSDGISYGSYTAFSHLSSRGCSSVWNSVSQVSLYSEKALNVISSALGSNYHVDLQQKILDLGEKLYQRTTTSTLVTDGTTITKYEVNLGGLVLPYFAYWVFLQWAKPHAVKVSQGVFMLAKSLFTGQLTYQTNLPSLQGCTSGSGCQASAVYLRQYTYETLIKEIAGEAAFATVWSGLAYLTHKGIVDAVGRASDGQYVQHVQMLSGAILAYPVLMSLMKTARDAIASTRSNNTWKSQFVGKDGRSEYVTDSPTYNEESIIDIRRAINSARNRKPERSPVAYWR